MSVAGSVIVCKGLRFFLGHSLELTVIALSACALQYGCEPYPEFFIAGLEKFLDPLFSKSAKRIQEFQGLLESPSHRLYKQNDGRETPCQIPISTHACPREVCYLVVSRNAWQQTFTGTTRTLLKPT